jgi:recombination protein RecT
MTPTQTQTKPAAAIAAKLNPQSVAKRGITDDLKSPELLSEVAKVLPKHLTAERLLRVTQTMVLYKPEILACTRDSIRRCVLICAQAGLEPDGRLAHIVAFKNTAQVIFDWKGLVALAARNNIQVVPKVVHANDTFEVLEDDGEGQTRVKHSIDFTKDRGEIVVVYSRAKMPDGTVDYEFMSADDVDYIRESFSRAKDSDPWLKSWGEMAKKTVIRRHTKRMDLMPEIRDVLYADDDTLATREPKPALMTRPVFSAPHALEAPPENGKDTPEMPQDEKQGIQTPPPASKPQESGKAEAPSIPKPSDQAVNVVKSLLKASKIKESELLGFLADIGIADPGCSNLEELDLASETAMGLIAEQWTEFSKRVLEARANPAPE